MLVTTGHLVHSNSNHHQIPKFSGHFVWRYFRENTVTIFKDVCSQIKCLTNSELCKWWLLTFNRGEWHCQRNGWPSNSMFIVCSVMFILHWCKEYSQCTMDITSTPHVIMPWPIVYQCIGIWQQEQAGEQFIHKSTIVATLYCGPWM